MKAVLTGGLAALTLLSGSARAQQGQQGLSSLWSYVREPSVMVGAGVEGYTRALAPQLNVGVTYGVRVGLQPFRFLGVELGYSGAVNGIDTKGRAAVYGRDLVRNGLHAAATVSPFPGLVRPYVMGGLGFSSYNIRGSAVGLLDNLVGNVPVGVGARTSLGKTLTADARLNYTVLFDEQFAVGKPVPRALAGGPSHLFISGSGFYSGTLNLGIEW